MGNKSKPQPKKHLRVYKKSSLPIYKNVAEESHPELELIDGDLGDVDPNNPILRMARSAEKLGLVASRDDIAENFDEILQQVITQTDDN